MSVAEKLKLADDYERLAEQKERQMVTERQLQGNSGGGENTVSSVAKEAAARVVVGATLGALGIPYL